MHCCSHHRVLQTGALSVNTDLLAHLCEYSATSVLNNEMSVGGTACQTQ
jgi:hypothetical protein